MRIRKNDVTIQTYVRTIICSVIEDIDKHFEEYAQIYDESINNITDYEKDKINYWKKKTINKLDLFLKKYNLIETIKENTDNENETSNETI